MKYLYTKNYSMEKAVPVIDFDEKSRLWLLRNQGEGIVRKKTDGRQWKIKESRDAM